jgi:ATP-binding cassette subfamily C (CFTR/MRP) protein 1
METYFISFERCLKFTSVTQEISVIPKIKSEEDSEKIILAEETGSFMEQNYDLEFKNFKIKYRDNLPLVLKGLSFKVEEGEHIGICGRTGSGKSTLILSILRIIEAESG